MDIGQTLPIYSIIPFVGMLLSIAIIPLINSKFWDKYQFAIAIAWSIIFLVPFTYAYGFNESVEQLAETLLLDYVPFIVLLFGLFVVSGGIHIGGTIAGSTKNNVILLAIGTILASWVGTTGAAMLLIRPVLRANLWRSHRKHIIIFFIFLVANMGGCLTPLGDPPLFLGFLRGVPFFWTLQNIWPLLILNSVVLLVMFAFIDRHYMKKEDLDALELEEKTTEKRTPFKIIGYHNFVFVVIIVLAVVLNGVIPQMPMFQDASGQVIGIEFLGQHLGINYFVQIVLILLAALLSMLTTKRDIRESNKFEWGPIAEVAKLFLGIFITMIPALALLRCNGANLGIDNPAKFFWASGTLSGFLDNSPTYVVFLTTAGALGYSGPDAIVTTVGTVAPQILLAISAGSVFMGALTYIGNAPNFMVKSMAESAKIKMPSFFGYMAWSICCLIPVFILDTVIFFL
ncbi:MAG: sodium:proton antiporter [Coriobacteriia bacterium]|nr:sodium:proton antiporter [Coriobacteriia bacterium]